MIQALLPVLPTPTRCKNPACWLEQPEPTVVCRICKTDKRAPVIKAVVP